MVIKSNTRVFATKHARRKALLKRTKKNKDIIFGARSIQAHTGEVFARFTEDWDILTKNPKKSAVEMEKTFDNIVGFNYFYTKPALHPGTHKVMGRGVDMRKGTADDEGIIDYSKFPSPNPPFKIIDGVRYRTLAQEKKAKLKALRDPEFKFRHKKDAEDLNRIEASQFKFKKINI